MENKFLCCSHNSTHNDHWFTFNFLLHCCSMHRREGASYLGVRPPLDRPQLCWWLPQLSQILPTAPLRVPPPHPAGTRTAGPAADGSYWFSNMPDFCHSRYTPHHSTAWITPLKRSADGAGDVVRSERLRPACVFTRPLSPSHPFFWIRLCFWWNIMSHIE